ncbi:glycosyltransferase family 4 protein [Ignavibacteria bacterium]|nr:glycosyltransferase [Bacteroidota bacterium]MCZ2133014.1 glycosyltransferase family 4 protein [Bacteroidota bacterium]
MHTRENGNELRKNKRMSILFLTPRFPWPLIGGDRIKSYHLLKHLARNNEVTLVTFSHNSLVTEEQKKAVEQIGVEFHAIPLNPIIAGLRSASSLFNDLPLEVAFYTQPKFTRKVDELCAERNFDLGISFFMRTAEYIRNYSFKKILIAEDCRLMYQSRSSEASKNLQQRIIRQWETHRLRRYEPEVTKHFDCTTLVTREDIAAMRTQNPAAGYALLTNGVELDVYTPNFNMISRTGILFVGKLDVWANEQMARLIIHEILPYIRTIRPDVALSIVGANPSASLRRLAGNGVEIYANVPSVKTYMQSAAVFLHPHKGASGIQNKALQAMACGCPVVTTQTGVQGIAVRHGEEVLIAKSSEELAEHALTLLNKPEYALRLARNARIVIEKYHSWEAIDNAFDNILAELFSATGAPQIKSATKKISL